MRRRFLADYLYDAANDEQRVKGAYMRVNHAQYVNFSPLFRVKYSTTAWLTGYYGQLDILQQDREVHTTRPEEQQMRTKNMKTNTSPSHKCHQEHSTPNSCANATATT